jgi:hypothetical protein
VSLASGEMGKHAEASDATSKIAVNDVLEAIVVHAL